MALGLFSAPDPALERYTVARQKTRVVLPVHRVGDPTSPCAGDLRDLPFVLYTSDFALHEHVLQQCEAAGFTPQVKVQTRYWDFIGHLVAADVGVAVMFEHVIARYDPQRVASRPLVEPEITWDVALMWRPGYLSRAARAWLDCVRAVYPRPLQGADQPPLPQS
jgi:DNA-binding transcriptional LysR family regulator